MRPPAARARGLAPCGSLAPRHATARRAEVATLRSRPLFAPVLVALVPFVAMAALGCGAGKAPDPANTPARPAGAAAGDGGASSASADAGPPPKPFAGSAAEATQLIGAAVDKGADKVQKCVTEYRARKNMPHERVTISMGIDQEGRLLGATLPKGKTDEVLSLCVQSALANAPFPRSHAGVISITKTYEEISQ